MRSRRAPLNCGVGTRCVVGRRQESSGCPYPHLARTPPFLDTLCTWCINKKGQKPFLIYKQFWVISIQFVKSFNIKTYNLYLYVTWNTKTTIQSFNLPSGHLDECYFQRVFFGWKLYNPAIFLVLIILVLSSVRYINDEYV